MLSGRGDYTSMHAHTRVGFFGNTTADRTRTEKDKETMSECTHGAMERSPSTITTTFVDNIFDAGLENIFRWSLDRARPAFHWTSPRNAKLLCDMSHVDHPLRSAAQRVVTELDISGLDKETQETLLNAYGGACKVLSLTNKGFTPRTWSCRELQKLGMKFEEDDMPLKFRQLFAAQRDLEELVLYFHSDVCPFDPIDAITEFGAGLKRLDIWGAVRSERESITQMLAVTGNTLSSLKIVFYPTE